MARTNDAKLMWEKYEACEPPLNNLLKSLYKQQCETAVEYVVSMGFSLTGATNSKLTNFHIYILFCVGFPT